MSWKKWAILGGGMLVAGGVVVAYALSQQAYNPPILTIASEGPGTVTPAVGVHTDYAFNETVVITAVPDDPVNYHSYWRINGQPLSFFPTEYSVVVNGNMVVSIAFVSNVEHGVITGIKGNALVCRQNFRFWYGNPYAPVDINETDESFNDGLCAPAVLTLQVHDEGQIGIPDVDIAVYPDPQPDGTSTRGLVLFERNGVWNAYTQDTPLIVKTGVDGKVRINVRNVYTADDITQNDGGKELSRASNLWAHATCAPGGGANHMPTFKGDTAGLFCWWSDNGGGGTIVVNKLITVEVVGGNVKALIPVAANYGVMWKHTTAPPETAVITLTSMKPTFTEPQPGSYEHNVGDTFEAYVMDQDWNYQSTNFSHWEVDGNNVGKGRWQAEGVKPNWSAPWIGIWWLDLLVTGSQTVNAVFL